MNIPLGGGYVLELGNGFDAISSIFFAGLMLFLGFGFIYTVFLYARRVSESKSCETEIDPVLPCKNHSRIAEEVRREKAKISARESFAQARGRTPDQEAAYQMLVEREQQGTDLDVYYQALRDKLDNF